MTTKAILGILITQAINEKNKRFAYSINIMTKSKEKDIIPEVTTDKLWLFLTRKSKDSSNTKAEFEYEIFIVY